MCRYTDLERHIFETVFAKSNFKKSYIYCPLSVITCLPTYIVYTRFINVLLLSRSAEKLLFCKHKHNRDASSECIQTD